MKHAIVFLTVIFFIPCLAGCELLLPDLKKVDDVTTGDMQGEEGRQDLPDQDDRQDPPVDPGAEEGVRCNDNQECEDFNPCNGVPFCNQDSHECEQIGPPPAGRECGTTPRRICINRECRESRCGDGFIDTAAGESCDPPSTGPCNAECKRSCRIDTDCQDGHPCTLDHCNTTSGLCDNTFLPSSTLCGPINGQCDVEEYCTGEEPACPPDRFTPSSLVCGQSMGACDPAEHCPGDAPSCPANRLLAAGDPCRAPTLPCELEATCDGSNPECPGNPIVTDGRICRGSTPSEYCDPAENCNGSNRDCPSDISFDTLHDITQLYSGENHALAKVSAGPLVGWGGNWHGELARGTIDTTESTPAEATLLSGLPITRISCGAAFTCILREGGLQCWGKNDFGQLGINSSIVTVPNPTGVSGLEPGGSAVVTDVSAGFEHACAVVDGGVMCWGRNNEGQLGDNSTTDRIEPTPVTGLTSNAVEVSAGSNFTCARLEDNTVKCWGDDFYSQLGDGKTVDSHVPSNVDGLTEVPVEIETGNYFACARSANFHVFCWGYNYDGQVGNGTFDVTDPFPSVVQGLTEPVDDISISSDGNFTCAHLRDENQVKCWGRNDRGQLGNGTFDNSNTAVSVLDASGVNPLGSVVMVAIGAVHACALMADGTVKCWGASDYGQAGDGLSGDRQYTLPVDVICGF